MGFDWVEHLAGRSAAVVAKGEVVAFRLVVREALDQEAEELARDGRVTAFSGGAAERFAEARWAGSATLKVLSQPTPRGHTPCVSRRGWRGAVPPLTPATETARRERRSRRLGEGPRQRRGACQVARQGALRGPDAVRASTWHGSLRVRSRRAPPASAGMWRTWV